MAGSDQSVNLSGMLGGIANTTGQMGQAFAPVLQAATKPRGDMEDPNHLRNLAQWASQNGDPQQASMYLQTAERISRERQAENLRVQKQAMQQAKTVATNAYAQAVKSGDPAAIQAAYDEAMRVSNDTGQDLLQGLRGVDEGHASQERAALQQKQAELAEQEKKLVAEALEKFKGADAESIMAVVDETPPEFRQAIQQVAVNQMRVNDYLADQAEKSRDMTTPLDWSGVEAEIAKIESPAQKKRLEATLKATRQTTDRMFVNGTWVSQGAKDEANKREERVLLDALAVHTAEGVAAERLLVSQDQQMADDLRRAAIKPIDDSDVEEYIKQKDKWYHWNDEPTWEDAKEALRRERLQPIYDYYGKPTPWSAEETGGKETLPAGVTIEVVTP